MIRPSFVLFLAVFLSLYGGLHVYLYRKLRRAFDMQGPTRRAVALLLLFMTGSPVFIHWVASFEIPGLTSAVACAAYLWMGGLFLFFSIHIVLDVSSFAAIRIHRHRGGTAWRGSAIQRRAFPAAVALTCAAILYGWFEAKHVRVELLVVDTHRLPEGMERLRVAQITDLHFGILDRMDVAHHVRDLIERKEPDILVCTGDFVDRGLHPGNPVIRVFQEMNPPGGKYAVPGNHEFYAGIDEATRILEEAGFVFLRNQVVTTVQGVRIAGVDDPAARRMGVEPFVPEEEVLAGLDDRVVTLLLKHQPRVDPASTDRFDMQLSGHTHKGQVFPFHLITGLAYPRLAGLYEAGERSRLYVSRGTGTWGPPLRVLAPPEITIIDFVKPAPPEPQD